MSHEAGSASWGHRPALDGLRTVAVYLVVLFHAGIGAFDGGFIGVDVFFVLSGFLVTQVILEERRSSGRIDLGRFYARRVRRLLPAAVVTIVVVAAVTTLVLPRLARATLVDDARASLLYVANWSFLGQATNYFAAEVDQSPYLHFWSLSIEEQFYVVYPAALLGLTALARRWRSAVVVPAGLAAAFVASFASQVLFARSDALRAYYGTDTRLYQLLAGALLAATWTHWRAWGTSPDGDPAGATRRRLASAAALAAVAGLMVVASSVVDLSASSRGIAAAGLSVVLVAALERAPRSVVGRVLSYRPITYLGRISYGTYLWHWPIIVLLRPIVDLPPWPTAAVATVGATAIAALSSRVLEMPIRRSRRLSSRAVVSAGLATSVICAIVVAPALLMVHRRPLEIARPSYDIPDAGALASVLGAPVPSDLDVSVTEPPEFDLSACGAADPEACVLRRGSGPHVTLLGDSNADVLIDTFLHLGDTYDLTISALTKMGCPWQEGLTWVAEDEALVRACEAGRAEWYDTVLPALQPDLVVTAGVPRDPEARSDGSVVVPADGVAAATATTLDRVSEMGIAVVAIEPLPYGPFDPTICLSGAAQVGECAYDAPNGPLPTEQVLRAEDARRSDMASVDLDRLACPLLPTCAGVIDGKLVFRNQFHLANPWLLDHRAMLWDAIESTGLVVGS